MIGLDFVTAGRALFTVSNGRGDHYTFRVSKSKDAHERFGHSYFVALLTGPNNEADYTYLGLLDTRTMTLRPTHKSPRSLVDGKPGQVFAFALRVLSARQSLPAGYDIAHCGHCGRCGRTLTVPESIETGIGPECARQMAGAA